MAAGRHRFNWRWARPESEVGARGRSETCVGRAGRGAHRAQARLGQRRKEGGVRVAARGAGQRHEGDDT